MVVEVLPSATRSYWSMPKLMSTPLILLAAHELSCEDRNENNGLPERFADALVPGPV